MSAIINTVGVVVPQSGDPDLNKSVSLSTQAIEQALQNIGMAPNELNFLINTALYKEDNIAEPALAALIQKAVGANLEGTAQSSTFSFDAIDGGGGALTAMELVAGFAETGELQHGVVVSSDVNPDEKNTYGFPYRQAASAIVISAESDPGKGFQCFRQYDFPEHLAVYKSTRAYRVHPTENSDDAEKRNILVLETSEAFEEIANSCVTQAVDQFFSEQAINAKDIDLVIPSSYVNGVVENLVETLGFSKNQIVNVGDQQSRYYTAGIGLALQQALESEVWYQAKRVLFVGVSPGVKITLALYHNFS